MDEQLVPEPIDPADWSQIPGADSLDAPDAVDTPAPDNSDLIEQIDPTDWITIHPQEGPEYEPGPEGEPFSFPEPPREAPEPPEGWTPGGPEGGW